jgi:H+/Cl- antiporter ClcA
MIAGTSKNPLPLSDYSPGQRVFSLSLLALLIGTLSAFMGWIFLKMIAGVINLAYYHRFQVAPISIPDPLPWTTILVPVVGGLIVGFLARFGSSAIRGHGIPEAMESIVENESRVSPRLAWLKPLASAISIGTGGPFGAEGPIIVSGGSLGSIVGQLLPLNGDERKTCLAAGAAGGMSLIFGTPIAAVLLAVELLLFEWKPQSLVPVALAAGVAQGWRFLLIGSHPMFAMMTTRRLPSAGLVWCLPLGFLAGVLAMSLTWLVYRWEDIFRKLPFHWMWWPALAGIPVGLIGWMDPRSLGVGYRNIRALLNGRFTAGQALRLFLAKTTIWSLALGSGTAGGVLAPLVMIGAAAGQLAGTWIPVGTSSLWALLMMAGVMGGAMRAPMTSILFGYEVTGNSHALLPLLITVMIAHLVCVKCVRRSIMTEKTAHRGIHIQQEMVLDVLTVRLAQDVVREMRKNPPTGEPLWPKTSPDEPWVSGNLPFMDVLEYMDQNHLDSVGVHAMDSGEFLGSISRKDCFDFLVRARRASRVRRRMLGIWRWKGDHWKDSREGKHGKAR